MECEFNEDAISKSLDCKEHWYENSSLSLSVSRHRVSRHRVSRHRFRKTTRFEGEIGEQATLFSLDPSGNVLEVKAFANDDMIFAA